MALPGELKEPEVGQWIKVHLPGESPWAECLAVHADGTWEGRIDNHLVGSASEAKRREVAQHFFPDAPAEPLPSLHSFELNDVVRFKREIANDYEIWVPGEQRSGRA